MSKIRGLTLPLDMAERFWARVEIGGPGYGQFVFATEHYLSHRVAWALTRGPVPEGKELDHDCRRRHCCNPAHLTPRTKAEHGRLSELLRKTRSGGRRTICG